MAKRLCAFGSIVVLSVVLIAAGTLGARTLASFNLPPLETAASAQMLEVVGDQGGSVYLAQLVFQTITGPLVVVVTEQGVVVLIDPEPMNEQAAPWVDVGLCPTVGSKYPEGGKATGEFVRMDRCPVGM